MMSTFYWPFSIAFLCICQMIWSDFVAKKHFISELINETFSIGLPTLPSVSQVGPVHNRSFVHAACFAVKDAIDKSRIGCCSKCGMNHLYNVLFEGRKIVLFSGGSSTKPGFLKFQKPIISFKMRREIKFNLPIEVRDEVFNSTAHCKSYFPGTLHVAKRSTTHNPYHAGNHQQQSTPSIDII